MHEKRGLEVPIAVQSRFSVIFDSRSGRDIWADRDTRRTVGDGEVNVGIDKVVL